MADLLDDRPRAETWKVQELVRDALRGRLRVPEFQRGLRWEVSDVALLLDSIYRGYPVGSLLLWRGRPRPEPGPCRLGEHVIEHPAMDDLRWIVDGQQRVTSLALTLTIHGQTDPRFRIWFDPDGRRFCTVHAHQKPGPFWVAAHQLLDANALQEMLFERSLDTPERRRTVIDAGSRIRDYEFPTYVISSESVQPLQEVFQRVNHSGKSLQESEVFDAFAKPEFRLQDVAARLRNHRWGEIDQETLLKIALCASQRDPTRTDRVTEMKSREVEAATLHLEAHVGAAIGFLRAEAQIEHIDLLPYQVPLIVLPAFFARFPRPNARVRTLLRRWTWRSFFVEHPNDPRQLRLAQRAVFSGGDEEFAVQQLLRSVPTDPARPWTIDAERRGRSDAAADRLGLLALSLLGPQRLDTHQPVEIFEILEASSIPRMDLKTRTAPYVQTIARWWLHPSPSRTSHRDLLLRSDPESLASHAISSDGVRAIESGDEEQFLLLRAQSLEGVVSRVVQGMAEWGASDRPSLEWTLRSAG